MFPDVQLTIRISDNIRQRLDAYVIANPDWSKSSVAGEALDRFLPVEKGLKSKRAVPGAGQDSETGKAGRDFGMEAGRRIAAHYGRLVSSVAATLRLEDGRHATVRTAKGRNTQWGCLNSVLKGVDLIYCAYAKDGKTFEVWEVQPEKWKLKARPASIGHKLHGKLTLVSKSDMKEIGKKIAEALLPFDD